VFSEWYEAAQTGRSFLSEYRFKTPQGQVNWLLGTAAAIQDQTGTVIGYFGIITDITERRQAEAMLRKSDEQRKLVLDLTHTGFWDWNIATNEVIWNEDHYRLLGLTPNEVKPSYQIWRDRVHPDDVDRVDQALTDALASQTEYEVEYRIIHADGGYRWVLARGQALYDESGQAVRVLGLRACNEISFTSSRSNGSTIDL
jgi:PAS domain S-box-containing protein